MSLYSSDKDGRRLEQSLIQQRVAGDPNITDIFKLFHHFLCSYKMNQPPKKLRQATGIRKKICDQVEDIA